MCVVAPGVETATSFKLFFSSIGRRFCVYAASEKHTKYIEINASESMVMIMIKQKE